MSNFHVGQKVVCIDELDYGFKKGDVATISKIELGRYRAHDGTGKFVCLNFAEVHTRAGSSGYDARYFRPIVERKTDISVFRAMLNPSKQQVPA